jgi:predicted nucleotidyltransferase
MGQLLKLVNTLGKNLHDEMPIRQLSKESRVPNTTAHRLINQNKALFNINQKGNIKLVSLNLEDNITKNYLILSEREEADNFLKKQPKFKVLSKNFPKGNYTVVLFGSRADSTHREKSDVDICVVNKDGKKDIEFSQFEHIYGLTVNPIVFKRKEFIDMSKEKEHNLADEIIKKHIILYGEEYFWNMIWQNGI